MIFETTVNFRNRNEANSLTATFIFGSGWCRGLWNTPRRDPKEFRIIRVLITVPLNVGLPVDRHLRAGRQRTTR